jgi:hypothetical protein
MGIYQSAENMLNEMLYVIASNDDIMKLIAYDDTITSPLSSTPIANPQDYIYSPESPYDNTYRLYPMCKIPNATEDKKTVICVELLKSKQIDNNPYFRHYIVAFDVVVHIDIKIIKGGIRRDLQIMDRINELFNQKYNSDTMKRAFQEDDGYVQYNDKFVGYRLIYSFTNKNSHNALCHKELLED